jgi:hypothetical protein
MKKALFLFLLATGISCSDDSNEKPIVCTFTFAGDLYEATTAECGMYLYGSQMILRNGNEFKLILKRPDYSAAVSVTLYIDTDWAYRSVGDDQGNFYEDRFSVDVAMQKDGASAGRLVCDCTCAEGTLGPVANVRIDK